MIEAVQFKPTGPWHAIFHATAEYHSDRTVCGRDAITAVRMWEDWAQHPNFRCQQCVRILANDVVMPTATKE